MEPARIAVVVPAFRTRDQVLPVIRGIGPEVSTIFVIDDACPQETGRHVQQYCDDGRVQVLFHEYNQGMGGAVITGHRAW